MPNTINFQPPTPSLEAEALSALVDIYLRDRELRVSDLTAKSYRYALSFLLRWWADAGPELAWMLTDHALIRWSRWLEKQPGLHGEPLTYNTRDMIHSRVRQLFHWSCLREYIERDFSIFVPAARGAPPVRQSTTLAALAQLMRAAGRSSKPWRDQAMLAVFIGTGIRRAECANLNVDDVEMHADQSGTLHIRKGKGDKPRLAVFDPTTGAYLAEYMDTLEFVTGPLWLGYGGKRLSTKACYAVVKQTAQRAGLADEIQGPHDLRRMFVTVWLRHRRGLGNAEALSLQMGHTSAKMTLQYSLQSTADVEATFISPMELLE